MAVAVVTEVIKKHERMKTERKCDHERKDPTLYPLWCRAPRVNLTGMGSAELCPECLQRYTVCCDCCGERIWMANDYGTHYLHLCASCRADNYVTCENCGALIPQEDAHYNDEDEAYCDSCYERGYGGTIHNYSYKPEPIFYGDGPLYLGVELEVDEAGKDNINAVKRCGRLTKKMYMAMSNRMAA